jgi:CRISPR-associated protein Cas2
MGRRRRYVVCYDIRDPDRLKDVGRGMKHFGYRFQYSVYICDLDDREKIALRGVIGDIIDHRVDTVALIDLGDVDTSPAGRFEWIGARTDLPHVGWTIW